MKKLTQADFLARATAAHGSRYDYSQAVYTSSTAYVTILCPQHGAFQQVPNSHCGGQKAGCPKCGRVKTNDWKRVTEQVFLARAQEAHGSRYNYGAVKFVDATTPVEITCSLHGSFWQSPATHTHAKHGCPECGKYTNWVARTKGRKGRLYIVELSGNGELFYKIGVTSRRVDERLKKIPYRARVLATYASRNKPKLAELEKLLSAPLLPMKYAPKTAFCGQGECYTSLGGALSGLPPKAKLY
ncbi:MAG: GIY-YIG nuclease family protein [Janthinobacterium lividum]